MPGDLQGEEEETVTTTPAPKERFPRLDKRARRSVAVLEQRRRYLTEKLATGDCSERSRSYLRDERDALTWVLGEVSALHSAGAAT